MPKNTSNAQKLHQKEFYNSVVPTYMKQDVHAVYADFIVSRLVSVLTRPACTILEIGAGQGRFTIALKKYAASIHAVDISKKEIDILRSSIKKRNLRGITAETADILTLNKTLPKKLYHHVVGFFILHHLPHTSMNDVVNMLSPYVKKGGTLSFVENNALSPAHLFAILLRPDMTWEVEKETYTDYIRRFKQACEKQGFSVTTSRVFGFAWPELVSVFPRSMGIDAIVSNIPLLRNIICPFILVSATKK
jgi:2-polyprenyl-3-methyl-5-hydroxy-6-metoxy-1,4-benzoquinol methylase